MQKISRKQGNRASNGTSVFKFFAAVSALLALFVLCSPTQLKAQLVTGDLLGTVTDSTGAVVPDAKVTVKNTGTGSTRSMQSNKTGDYVFSSLQIGTYKVTVEAQGFKTFAQSGLVLAAGDRARLDAKLTIGSQVETVEIEASSAPALKTDSSTMDTLISTTAVSDLPLNGRNITNLVQLSAGVTEGAANAPGGAAWTGGHADDLRQTSVFSANGQSDMFNNQMIDGMDNNERTIGTQVVKPSIDAIDQVQVMTNLYPAEYGRTAGGMMNVITKSGTNSFHGTLFEYLRNDALDAYAYVMPGGKPNKGELRQNQFGGSVSGPIFKNKTFFFGDYEGLRVVNALSTQNITVPSLTDQTAVAAAAVGSTVTIHDTFFPTATNNGTPGEFTATVTNLGKNLFALYPHPNQTGTIGSNGSVSSNFSWTPATRQQSNSYDARVDHHFSDRDLLFGRFSYNKTDTAVPAGLPAATVGGKSYMHSSQSTIKTAGLAVDWVHTFTPSMLMEVKAGYTRFNNHGGVNNDVNAATNIGFAACSSDASATNAVYCINSKFGGANEGMPNIGPEYYGNLGDGMWGPLNNINQSYQYSGTLTWNHNNHSVKGGIGLIRRQLSRTQSPSARGSYSINPIVTGSSIADMLQGIASSVQQQTTLAFPNFRSWEPSAFIQDDYRALPWLTLNFGVRYDIYTPYTDAHGQFSNFNTTKGVITSPSLLGVYAGSRTDDVKADYSNISPRLGFSASLAHQMVVRGGFAVSYFTNEQGGGTVVSMANFPYTWSVDYGGDNYMVTPPTQMAYSKNSGVCSKTNTAACALNLAAGITEPYLSPNTVSSLPAGTEIDGVSNDLKSGRLVQYSLEVQKEYHANVFALGYIGNAGRHLPWVPNVNQATSASAAGQGPTPYTAATTVDGQNLTGDSIFMTSSAATSNYNALQASLTRRISKGLAASINYTWAKNMNNGSPQGEGGNRPVECVRAGCVVDQGNGSTKTLTSWKTYDWGPSDLNVGQRVSAMINYEIPFGKNLNGPLGYAVKGWNINAVGAYNTSLPESVAEPGGGPGSNVVGITGWRGGDAPNQVLKSSKGKKSINSYFNGDAYKAQTEYLFGNVQRNSLYGPNQRHLDMAVSKDFKIYEAVKLQFRADAFNVTNTVNLGLPNSTLSDSNFTKITSVSGAYNPRLFQFALRMSF
jgi:hypothetical protein